MARPNWAAVNDVIHAGALEADARGDDPARPGAPALPGSAPPVGRLSIPGAPHHELERSPLRADEPGVPARVRHRRRVGGLPARPRRGDRRGHLGQEEGAAVAPRLAPEGLPPLARDDRAEVGEGLLPADRLPGDPLLRRAEVDEGRPEEPRGRRPRAPPDVREARRPARGARHPRGRRRRRGLRQRVGRDDVPREPREGRRHLLLLLRGGARAPRPREEVPRERRPLHRQLLRDAQLGGLLGRLLLLRAEGGPLPDGALDLLPDQPGRHRPVRADAHRRRGRGLGLLPRGVHGPEARHEPAPRRRRRARRPRRRHDQVLHRPELVPRRQGRQGRHLQLRHQARQVRREDGRRSPGRRSRPARRSPGSTRAASSSATTPSASSTRSPSRTTTSRPTPARR